MVHIGIKMDKTKMANMGKKKKSNPFRVRTNTMGMKEVHKQMIQMIHSIMLCFLDVQIQDMKVM